MPVYNAAKAGFLKADIDLESTMRLVLMTSSYTANIDTQDFWDDISANEISGTGYTTGGATLANGVVTTDTTDDEGVYDADDVTWTTATFTARYAVLIRWTGTPGTSALVGYWDFGSDKSPAGVDFTCQFAAEGVVNLG